MLSHRIVVCVMSIECGAISLWLTIFGLFYAFICRKSFCRENSEPSWTELNRIDNTQNDLYCWSGMHDIPIKKLFYLWLIFGIYDVGAFVAVASVPFWFFSIILSFSSACDTTHLNNRTDRVLEFHTFKRKTIRVWNWVCITLIKKIQQNERKQKTNRCAIEISNFFSTNFVWK